VDCIHFTKDKDVGEEAKTEGYDPEGKQLFIDPEEWNKRSGPPKLDSELSYKFCIN
jgi:hypothetical protein